MTRVLLVDDAPELRRAVRLALSRHGGFDVVGEAGTGAEAVELATQLRPDIVVLDLGLPDLAGREVLTRLHAMAATPKIVVFSGTETTDRRWISDRVEGYVVKGSDLSYLVNLLATVAQQRTGEFTIRLARNYASVQTARRFVRHALQMWGAHQQVEDAVIVVSELVTNAIAHTHTGCELRISRSGGREGGGGGGGSQGAVLRIEVNDRGAEIPDVQVLNESREHGRGLHIVAALTNAWGVDTEPDGSKTVWAELIANQARSTSTA
jgi:DNA-binding NarL/FixJ family response regulator